MQIEKRDLESSLPRKGFERDVSRQHHTYFNHRYQGKYTGAYTYISHGMKMRSIGSPIIKKMKDQLRLDNSHQVVDLVNCPISGDDYIQILRSKGQL